MDEMSTPISQLGNAPQTQTPPIMPGGSGGVTASTVPAQLPSQHAFQQVPQPNVQQQYAHPSAQQPSMPQWNNPLPMNMHPCAAMPQHVELSNPSKLNLSNNAWDSLSILMLFICLNSNGVYKISNNVLPTLNAMDKCPSTVGIISHGIVAACIFFLIKKFI